MDALGQWWLPEAPETRVVGLLRIHDDGLCELELLGTLRSNLPKSSDGSEEPSVELTDALLAESGVSPRILDQADGRAFTL